MVELTIAGCAILVQCVACEAFAVESPQRVDASLTARAGRALVYVVTGPVVFSKHEPVSAGALVPSLKVGTVVGTATIRGGALVNI